MMLWKRLRESLLILTLGMTVLVLGKAFLIPSPDQKAAKAPASPESPSLFPDQVPLPGWRALKSQPLAQSSDSTPDQVNAVDLQASNSQSLAQLPGRLYQYAQGNYQLSIEVKYADELDENAKLFRKYSPAVLPPNQLDPVVRRQDAIGFYSLAVQDKKVHLRSCISPRGETAITYEQFIRNRYTADLELSRLPRWLVGQEPLRDYRCLWVHLSTPLENAAPEAVYPVLETAWVAWYDWWQPRFPKI